MGGQLLGLSPHAGEIRAALLVGSGHGWWRAWPTRRGRLGRWWTWRVLAPLAVPVFGRLPGWLRGRPTDTPPGIARETIRFSASPHFFIDAHGRPLRPHNADIRAPLRLLVFTDDRIVPPGAELDVSSFYPNAVTLVEHLSPEQFGATAVDHFGFFRSGMAAAAWDDVAAWLTAHTT